MIYTVTLNPAVDYVMYTDGLTPGIVCRSKKERLFFGGKGVNVSLVLRELDVPSEALGFIAGFTGEAIEAGVREKGVKTDFIRLEKGFSRINVKIKAGEETELNGQGPEIPESAVEALLQKLEKLRDGDTLVLAGSVPHSLPRDIYEQMLKRLKGRKIRAVADATGDLLRNVLKYRPFLIKPNHLELGELFGVSLQTADEIAQYARKLQEMGAVNVLVSRAADGAVLLDETGKLHTCGVCRGTVRNSVGAGDSMVAGFLAGLEKGGYGYALRLGTAAGGATAFSEGLAQKEEIERLLKQL